MKFKYGTSYINFDLPEAVNWQVVKKELPFSPEPEDKLIQSSVTSLINQLSDRPEKKNNILLIVPDHTRRCRLEILLPVLIPQLEDKFHSKITILVANGSHVLQPEETIIDLVGQEIATNYPVLQHDAKDQDALYLAGHTSNGTPVWLTNKVREADFVITIGGILYHYFAGFGGGPKMLLPGVASYETIRLNHKRTIDPETGHFHSECKEGNIITNPVYTDLVQVLDFVPNILSMQMALSISGEIICAEAGPVVNTQKSVCKKVEAAYSLPLDKAADVVIASAGGFPSDVNLIQTHKSIHHAFQAVKKNGHIILLAECAEGVGSKTFTPYLEFGEAQNIGQALLKDYKINGHTALSLRTKAEKANIIFVSSLDKALVEKTGMIPADSIESAWGMVKNKLPKNAIGYVMEKVSAVVPVISN